MLIDEIAAQYKDIRSLPAQFANICFLKFLHSSSSHNANQRKKQSGSPPSVSACPCKPYKTCERCGAYSTIHRESTATAAAGTRPDAHNHSNLFPDTPPFSFRLCFPDAMHAIHAQSKREQMKYHNRPDAPKILTAGNTKRAARSIRTCLTL